jgi:hypothetical protein
VGIVQGLLAQNKKSHQDAYTFEIVPSLHTTGHFQYTGAYVNNHLNADIQAYYERQGVGFLAFKSLDFVDAHTAINYLQIGAIKKWRVNKKVVIMPYVGYLFVQSEGFRDRDSDFWSAIKVEYKLNDQLTIENTMLLLNVVKTELGSSFNNRFKASVVLGQFEFEIYLWYKRNFDNAFKFVSGSTKILFPKIKIHPRFYIRNALAIQSYLSNEKPSFAQQRGILFSTTFPLDFSH